MAIQKFVDKFHILVRQLWTYMKEQFPDQKDKLNQSSKKFRQLDPLKYLTYTLDNLEPYINQIARYDETMYNKDNLKGKQLNFLIGYDFAKFMHTHPNITPQQKKCIFTYLQFMYIQSSRALSKNAEMVSMMLEAIKVEKEVKEEVEEKPDEFEEGMSLEKLFGGDSLLMELAKDITEEVNLSDTLKEMMENQQGNNPMDVIMNLSQNPELKNMMDKITNKMKDKNITSEQMQNSTKTMMENFENSFDGPIGKQFKKFMKNIDMEKMMQGMVNGVNGPNSPNGPNGPNGPNVEEITKMMNNMMGSQGQQITQEQMSELFKKMGQTKMPNPDVD